MMQIHRTISVFILLFVACGWLNVSTGNVAGQTSSPSPPPDSQVGRLKSKGEVSVKDAKGKVQLASSQKPAEGVLYTGNTVRVGVGDAALELVQGGKITIHSNSNLTPLQSHSPYLFTLAEGALSFELKSAKGDAFFTPDFIIKTDPDAAGQATSFKGEISLAANGTLCVQSREGRLHITMQNNKNVLDIPSGGSMAVMPPEGNGDPRILARNCDCLKPDATPPAPTPYPFTIQVGAFSRASNAEKLKAALSRDYSPLSIRQEDGPKGTLYHVLVGQYADYASARQTLKKLKAQNHRGWIVRIKDAS